MYNNLGFYVSFRTVLARIKANALIKSFLLFVLLLVLLPRAESAGLVPVTGKVMFGDTPLCTMVLANGQTMFSCSGDGSFNLSVPLDTNGQVTLMTFAQGFAPFRQTLSPAQVANTTVNMERETESRDLNVNFSTTASARDRSIVVNGTIDFNGTPLCALMLANGQHMFSCNNDLGRFSLEVPLDSSGNVTLFAFVSGFQPFKVVIKNLDSIPLSDVVYSDPLLAQCVDSEAAANGLRFAEEVTQLNCSQAGIRLFNGLQSFTNLETLNLSGNNISDIAQVSGLVKLKTLDISSIPTLRNIDPLLVLNELATVNLDGTGSGDIGCTTLDTLSQKVGSLTRPDSCKKLISDVVFADAAMQSCVMTEATRLGLTFTRDLISLSCQATGITQLDGIEHFEKLQSINFSGNLVSDLTPLGQLLALENVSAEGNPISDVFILSALPSLKVLDLSNISVLKNIDLLINSSTLRQLFLKGSGDGELSCSSLDGLSITMDSFSRPIGCSMLISDVVFADAALKQCVLDKAAVAGITFTSELNNITCSDLGITSLEGMGEFVNVEALIFNNNSISDLSPLRNLLKMRGLFINNNNVKDFFALDHLGELRLIEARDNTELSNVNTIVYMGNVKFLRLAGSGTGQKIACADLDKLSVDILSRQIGDPTSPPEFEPPESCNGTSTTGINAVVGSDLNADGLSDIVLEFDPITIQGTTGLNTWLMGTSFQSQFNTGAFGDPRESADIFVYAKATAIAVADANKDDKDDVLVQLDKKNGAREWQVYASDGNALVRNTLPPITIPGVDSGDDARAVAFTDVNADGYADILIQAQGVESKGTINYYLIFGGPSGYGAPVLLYRFSQKLGRPEIIALEDVNNDGMADFVFDRKLGNRHCYFVRTFQNGTFEKQPRKTECAALDLPIEWDVKTVGVADMTGNGLSELVISYVDRGRTVWSYYPVRQGASGSEWGSLRFFAEAAAAEGTQFTVAVADLNKDGRADILSEVTLGTQKTWVAHIADDYGVSTAQLWLTGDKNSLGYMTLGLKDYNGDKLPDLLLDVPGGGVGQAQRLFVKINDTINFESQPWTVWFQSADTPKIIGVEEDGLTTLAHSNNEIFSKMGSIVKYTHNELRDELAIDGMSLRNIDSVSAGLNNNKPLASGECELAFDSKSDGRVANVKFGMLVCAVKVGDHIKIETSALYAECEAKAHGGFLEKCEWGTFKDKLTVDLGAGVAPSVEVKGPNQTFCAGIVSTGACAGIGSNWAEAGGAMKFGDNSAGASAGFGVGFDAAASLEDGVFSGKLGGKFLAGFTIEVSVDLKPIYSISKDVVLFVGDNAEKVALAAGEGIIDVVNTTGKVGEVLAGEAIFVVTEGADAAIVVFTAVGESLVDIVNGIESGLAAIGGAAAAVGGVVIDIGNGIGDGLDAVADFFDSIF